MALLLFDVDGTLTPSGDVIRPEMIDTISKLFEIPNIKLGLVGGGNLEKIKFQMGDVIKYFKYIFAECGAVVYIDGKFIQEKNMLEHCDRDVLNVIIKKALRMICDMPIIYHGQQTDFRKGLVYISPPGMQATPFERNFFMDKDKEMGLRNSLLKDLKSLDTKDEFEMSLGGAVGIAVHPKGWNKSQVVDYLIGNKCQDKLYYFGDRTEPDGNDYPIYSHKLVTGYSVKNYQDTIQKLHENFIQKCNNGVSIVE